MLKSTPVLFGLLLLLAMSCLPQPVAADTMVEKALGAFYQKNFDEAMTDFDQAAANDTNNTFALVMWLESAHRLNRIPDVVTSMEQRVQKAPNDARMLAQLGLAYMYESSDKYTAVTAGQQAFDKSLTIDPNCAVAHAGLGLYYFTGDKVAKARNQLQKALEVNPKDLIALERLGEITLTNDDKPELSLFKFKPLVAALPTYPDAYFFMGMALEKSKKTGDAMVNYERAIQLDPYALTRSVYARIRLSRLYQDNHKRDRAVQVLQDLVNLRPDFKEAKQELTDAQSRK